MSAPIAELYSSRSSPLRSPPLSPFSGRLSRSTHRTSVSIKASDDPFAAPATQSSEDLGGESWKVSEESIRPTEAENGAPLSPPPGDKAVRRTPSFLRGLLPKGRRSRSSSQVSKSDISGPIATVDPPRIAPLRSTASLVSFSDATQNYSIYAESSNPDSYRVQSPEPSYPSGTNSLRIASTSSSRPAVFASGSTNGGLSRAPSRTGSIRIEGPRSVSRQGSFVEPIQEEFPPTESAKAFQMLGGPRVTEKNRKAVERLTGVRTSVYGKDDLGIALTTDAPTRYVVPDNARTSIASYSTEEASDNRSTLYSSNGSFSRPGFTPHSANPNHRDTTYSNDSQETRSSVYEEPEESPEPTKEAPKSAARQNPRFDRPISPPPSVPLPPIPLSQQGNGANPSGPRRQASIVRFKAETRESIDSAATAKPQAQPVRPTSPVAPPPAPRIPPKSAQRSSFVRRQLAPRPASRDGLLDVPPSSRQPVSSATLPKSPSTTTLAGPAKPVASMYLVAGLPKDPSTWTLSGSDPSDPSTPMPDHSENAVPRFWRPEVLGCTVTGGKAGQQVDGVEPELVSLSKEEIAKIQSKVIKLSFDRDIEIIASTSQPAATTSFFSFPVTTSTTTFAPAFAGSTAAAWDTALAPPSSASAAGTTYHATCLLVWSYADEKRSAMIRTTLAEGAKAKAAAVRRAAKAAKAGKKLGEKLAQQMESPMGAVPDDGRAWAKGAYSDTEGETEANVTESEWEASVAAAAPLADLPSSTPFWLPYALVLVSTSPVYSLLSDVLRISWARYSQSIVSHSLQMERVLNSPAPRPGEKISLPVSVSDSQTSTSFVAIMPGSLDWTTGSWLHHNVPTWPLFKALHPDNLLSIAELALAPLGRILLISRHSIMLGVATLTLQLILEKRGWKGLVFPVAHARDLRIYLEDPGPWLCGVPSTSRSVALAGLPPEVVVVDLDTNVVTCAKPSPSSVSSGAAREKSRRRLESAIGTVGPYFSVPLSIVEAFPAGRFRPFSDVEVDGEPREAERLLPDPSWNWDESRVLAEFDAILSEIPRSGIVAKLFRTKKARKIAELDRSTAHVQNIVRKHATTFVDRRDILEGKISKLNQKLAFLMGESVEWQQSFDVFKAFSEKLTRESADLKTRLEKERREASRLSNQIASERVRQAELEAGLEATERAREQALAELASVDQVRSNLEEQRNIIMQEIMCLLSADDESNPIFQAVYTRIESRSSSSSRPGSAQSLRQSGKSLSSRPSFSVEGGDVIPEERENVDESTPEPLEELSEEARLVAMKEAVHETFRSISTRLSLALQNAKQLELAKDRPHREGRAFDHSANDSHLSRREDETITTGAFSPADSTSHPPVPPSPDLGPFQSSTTHPTPGFQPKRLTLTPPVSPDFGDGPPSFSFVTTRQHRRTVSKPIHHGPQESVSSLSGFTSIDSQSSSAPSTAGTIVQHPLQQHHSPRPPSHQSSHPSLREQIPSGLANSASRLSDYSDYDDAQSFVSVSEGGDSGWNTSGGGGGGGGGDSRAPSPGSFDLEELAWTAEALTRQPPGLSHGGGGGEAAETTDEFEDLLSSPRSTSAASTNSRRTRPPPRGGHGRQDSFAIDAPPVELFTRSGSVRGRRGGDGSVDLRMRPSEGKQTDLRMRPSDVKQTGRWATITETATRPRSTMTVKAI
ncbi:hypothetical protein JCM5296_000885 [Sporobolomyces johnsonii]